MVKNITILILLALGFSQDKWELKFGNYYYSPTDAMKPKHLTKASIMIDSNSDKDPLNIFDLNSNKIDQAEVENYLVYLKSNKLYVQTIENIIKSQYSIPDLVLHVLSDKQKIQLGDSYHISEDAMYKLSNQLQSLISIENIIGTDLYTISMHSRHPSQAAFLINVLIDTFVDMIVNLKSEQSKRMEEFLVGRFNEESKRLDNLESELASFQKRENMYQLDPNSKLLMDPLLVMTSNHYELENENLILEERRKYLLETLSAKEVEFSSESSSRLDSRFYALKDEVAHLEIKYLESKAISGEEHSETEKIGKRIKIARDTLEGIVNKHVIQRDMITGRVEYQKALINDLIRIDLEIDINEIILEKSKDLMANYEQNLNLGPRRFLDLINLKKECSISASLCHYYRQEIEEERIRQSSLSSGIMIVEYAVSPTAK